MEETNNGAPACSAVVLRSVQLPTDRPRQFGRSVLANRVDLTLSPHLLRQLESVAAQQGATAHAAVLASWMTLLGRLGGHEDLVAGLPLSDRCRGSLDELPNPFAGTVALRVRLQDHLTVGELVRQVQVAVDETRARPLSVLYAIPVAVPQVPGACTAASVPSVEETGAHGSAIDLALSLQQTGHALLATIHYSAELFDVQTIERWAGHFYTLLSQFASQPQAKLSELDLLSAEERHWLLRLCESAGGGDLPAQPVHLCFENQVKQTPDLTAVIYGEVRLSYAQLNREANKLAHYLLSLGVRPEGCVAICVERGIEMLVGTLGILKAGATYVPVDPRYPPSRRAFMLADSAPVALLTQSFLQRCLPEAGERELPVVFLDLEIGCAHSSIGRQPDHDPELAQPGLSPRNLAYVIYTSGSTGTPKGVQVGHGNLSNLVSWYVREIPIVSRDSLLIVTSYGFDITQKNIFGPLQVGGTVVLAPEPFDARAILDLIRRENITHLNLTPSAFYTLLEADHAHDLGCVRWLMLGGESIQPARLARLREPRPQLFNFYGPTECTILCAFHRLEADLGAYRHRAIPIGKPVSNSRLYVLDSQGRLVPPGVTGEVHVAGEGVARGYRRSPGLTATRFLPDPFGPPGTRMYRTGDLGRYRADGAIEYLGRNDHQVKIRGFRIEPTEIEAQLIQQEQVKEAAVIAREDEAGQKQLVAYVVPHTRPEAEASLNGQQLRNLLASVLPDYMVPSAWVILPALPLTTNGKLDRSALPAPDPAAFAVPDYESPRGELEQALAGIWQELLGAPRVGRGDSFFELGGTSLLIAQMNERLHRLGLFASARNVFANPTLAALADTLSRESAGWQQTPPNLIPPGCTVITPEMLTLVQLTPEQIVSVVRRVPGGAANIQDIYPLAPLQQGILFHHILSEQADTYVVATLLACRAREHLDALIAALQSVIDRHDVLRSAIFWEDLAEPVQVVYRRAPLPVEELILDQNRDVREQLEEWMTPNRLRLDLREAPLLRVQVASNSHSGEWYVLLRLHHVASDHVAREILNSEIMALIQGREQDLPRPVAYRNHVAQVLAAARPDVSERFFRAKLADIDEPTAPFGLLEVRADGSDVDVASRMLDPEVARSVRAQARRLRVSAAALFHAAWAIVVACTSRRDDVVFGTVLSGRLRGSVGVERIFGMFINTLPLRLRLRGASVTDLVEQTQRELAELLEHEQVPLALAQRCSGITGRAPLFSALLNYVHGPSDSGVGQLTASGIQMLVSREWTNYPIAMSVDDLGDGFILTARTDRRVSPERITGYLQEALQSLAAALKTAPGTTALSLSIRPLQERLLVESGNATRMDYGCDKLIHELFEEQVDRTPGAVALVCSGRELSYAELNARANQLARYLLTLGVGTEKLVGICMDRNEDMVIALLAVLKAGGAYVPLDPNYPAERLTQILADAMPQVVLANRRLRTPGAVTAARVVVVDALRSVISRFDSANLGRTCGGPAASRLAYVIYTSGSTGRPKGVMIEQRSAVNLLCWARSSLPHEHFQRTLFATSLNFDLSVYECFVPLAVGGVVVLTGSVLDLSDRSVAVTLINTVPSAMDALLARGAIPKSTRHVNLAGEVLEHGLVERVFSGSGVNSICNLYGPSETTTYSTWLHMDRQSGFEPTIGRPIANTQIHVLDPECRPVPIGVPGEVYIGGIGVARGYLNRPELTAQRFIPDPFGSESGSRLYKTGDLGRWRANGSLEYLGRNDRQVKLRGFRIELAEIESQLVRYTGVGQGAVIVREEAAGQKRLVAYFTRRGLNGPSVEELRAHLKAHLPEYMVPSVFVAMEALPLMPNGKLDRSALPAPQSGAPTGPTYSEPRGETETTLAHLWRELLRIEQVGRDDDYFELGGQSLLAMKLVVRITEAFNVHLPVYAIFSSSKLREMAQAIQMLRPGTRVSVPRDDEVEFEQGVL